MEIVRDVLINVILLFGLVTLLSLTNTRVHQKNLIVSIASGLLIGVTTILIIMNGWEMQSGLTFDTRSVIISVTALFFSTITSGLAMLIAIIYRIFLGGSGVYAGVLTLLTSFLIGVLWKKYLLNKTKINKYVSLYIFGLIVHIAMLLSQLASPYPLNIEVLRQVSPIVITVFPIAVML